ncbi:MAG: hypothetical protein ACQEQC_08200 [Elusimicrobiota bacterium]
MTEPKEKYAVILTSIEKEAPKVMAEVISEIEKITIYKAARIVSRSWGIFQEMNKDKALKLKENFKTSGIAAKVIPEKYLKKLPDPTIIQKIDIKKDDLSLYASGYNPHTLPWEDLLFIAGAKIEHKKTVTKEKKEGPGTGEKIARLGIMATTGIPVGLGKKKKIKKNEIKTEVKYFIDLIMKDPLKYVRINMLDFDFTTLKDDMKNNIYGNFKTLILKLKEKAVNAKLNRGSRFYTGIKFGREPVYRNISDLSDECSWFITLYLLNKKDK